MHQDGPAIGDRDPVAVPPHSGKHIEIRFTVALSVRIVPERHRHGRHRRGHDELAHLASHRPSRLVERVDGDTQTRRGQLPRPDRHAPRSADERRHHVGPAGDRHDGNVGDRRSRTTTVTTPPAAWSRSPPPRGARSGRARARAPPPPCRTREHSRDWCRPRSHPDVTPRPTTHPASDRTGFRRSRRWLPPPADPPSGSSTSSNWDWCTRRGCPRGRCRVGARATSRVRGERRRDRARCPSAAPWCPRRTPPTAGGRTGRPRARVRRPGRWLRPGRGAVDGSVRIEMRHDHGEGQRRQSAAQVGRRREPIVLLAAEPVAVGGDQRLRFQLTESIERGRRASSPVRRRPTRRRATPSRETRRRPRECWGGSRRPGHRLRLRARGESRRGAATADRNSSHPTAMPVRSLTARTGSPVCPGGRSGRRGRRS